MNSNLKTQSARFEKDEKPQRTHETRAALRTVTGNAADAIELAEELEVPTAHRKRHAYQERYTGHNAMYSIIYRFLNSKHGMVWNDVWADVCATYPINHPAREAIKSQIEFGIINSDGSVQLEGSFGPTTISADSLNYMAEHFVDQDGILHSFDKKKKYQRKPQPFSAYITPEAIYILRANNLFSGPKEDTLTRTEATQFLRSKGHSANLYESIKTNMLMYGYDQFTLPNGDRFFVKLPSFLQVNTKVKANFYKLLPDPSLFKPESSKPNRWYD